MNIDEKIKAFDDITMNRAEEQRRLFETKMRDAVAEAVADARNAAEYNKTKTLKSERIKIERDNNKLLSDASIHAKREMSALRERLSNELYNKIKNTLRSFAVSDGYGDYLLRMLAKKLTGDSFYYIQLMRRDFIYEGKIKTAINANGGHEIEYTDDDFIGGFVLYTRDRKAIKDCTLALRLEETRFEFNIFDFKHDALTDNGASHE